ncbi:MAG: AEC family transporter [Clostridiales bacterium]|nr:AEC family transporter [Clostridiales bacterium]
MASLILAFNVVFPILAYMMIGFTATKLKIWSEDAATTVNKLLFTFFLPVLLFENIRGFDLAQGLDARLTVFALATVFITYGLLFLFIPMIEKDRSRRGVMIQGIYRSNYIIIGVPMTQTILGRENIGFTAALIGIIIPLFNIMAIIAMEVYRDSRIHWGRLLQNVVKNPFVIATVFGFGVLFSGISLPVFLTTTTLSIGRAATPMALAAMGGCFRFGGAKNCLKQLAVTVIGKLVLMPTLWLTIAALMGFRGHAFISLMSLYGAPVAVSSYSIAQQMGGDSELASQVVVYTSAFSILTLFLITFITKSIGLY